MKKYKSFLLILVLSLASFSSQAMELLKQDANNIIVSKTELKTDENLLLFRLNEIKTMDKSTLTTYERNKLRKEVRVIKKELVRSSGGIYLSVGAILLIILLLIILL